MLKLGQSVQLIRRRFDSLSFLKVPFWKIEQIRSIDKCPILLLNHLLKATHPQAIGKMRRDLSHHFIFLPLKGRLSSIILPSFNFRHHMVPPNLLVRLVLISTFDKLIFLPYLCLHSSSKNIGVDLAR